MQRAVQAVEDLTYNVRENDVIKGDILREQGDLRAQGEGALEKSADSYLEKAAVAYKSALIRQPNDPKTRYKRGMILFELGELEEALKEAKNLKAHTKENAIYTQFLDDVQAAIEKEKKKSEIE